MEPSSPAQAQRKIKRLTQEEIEHAMALERRPFRPPGLDRFARLGPVGAAVLELLAEAAENVERMQDIRMEYKERVLREYAAKGYVVVTVHDE